MAEGLKVRYRQGSDTTTASEEYWVVAKPGMPEKWREDPTIPLTHVMQSFDIFRREGASGQAPRSDLMRVFGTEDRDEVIKKILAEGDWPAVKDTVFQQHKSQRSTKK